MPSNIEWTDAVSPLYNLLNGTDTRRRFEDRGEEGRSDASRIPSTPRVGAEVVHKLPNVAVASLIRQRRQPLGRPDLELSGIPQSKGLSLLRAKAGATARTELCASPRRRFQAGATAGEFLRRVWTHAAAQFAAVCRLRPRVVRGGASS